MYLLNTLFIFLLLILNPVRGEEYTSSLSFPLIFASYREIEEVHSEIAELRKVRNGGVTDIESVESIVNKILKQCPSDEYVIIDQPGLKVSDFQEIWTRYDIILWEELRKFLSRAATIGSFPRINSPLNIDKLERYIIENCKAETIVADLKYDPPIEEYHDTRPRVIKMKFDPLPEDETERIRELQKNDAKLLDVLRQTPSPFYTLIYTSSSGEEYYPKDQHRNQRYWDIFADIVRQKRDPRNRLLWKQHLERSKKEISDEPVSRLPPRAEYDRQKSREAAKKSTINDGITNHGIRDSKSNSGSWIKTTFNSIEWDKYDRLFSTDIVAGIIITNVAILAIYLCINIVKNILS